MERMKQRNSNSTVVQNTLYSLFDESEIDVAKTFLQLQNLISESNDRNQKLKWGARRRRSAINLSLSPSPLRSMPPPPSTTITAPPVNETCGGGYERLLQKPETASPATPLCFSPSESEEKSKRSTRKFSKRRMKREELLELIAELTQCKELLKGEVETVRLHYNKIKALNLELKAKRKELSCGEKVGQCMEINQNLTLRMEFLQPIVKSVMNIEDMEILENQHRQPLIVNQTVRKSDGDVGMVKVNIRGPLGIIPDLNVSVRNGSGMIPSALINTADFNKAMAAEARKKRSQIYKLKNSVAANKRRYG